MEKAVERGLEWAGLPVMATVARLLCRELTLQNEYLRLVIVACSHGDKVEWHLPRSTIPSRNRRSSLPGPRR